MTAQTKPVLKSYFETGDKPTATQFADLIDSIPGTAGVLADSEIPSTIARDTEVTATTSAAVSAHAAASDPHGDRAYAAAADTAAIAAHAAASDPHGDRAYAAAQAAARKMLTDYSNVVVVDPGGNGDYTTQAEAAAAITDDDASHVYNVFVFGEAIESATWSGRPHIKLHGQGADLPVSRRAYYYLRSLLESGLSCALTYVTDSTGDATDEWIYQFAQWVGKQYSAYSVKYRAWNDTIQGHGLPVSLQLGTAGYRYITFDGGASALPRFVYATAMSADIYAAVPIVADDYTPATAQGIVNRGVYSAGDKGWMLQLRTDGKLEVIYNATSIGYGVTYTSTDALSGVTDGVTRVWVAFLYDRDNGSGGSTCHFYQSLNEGQTWTSLGSHTRTTNNLIFSSTSNFEIGGGGATSLFRGKIGAPRIYTADPAGAGAPVIPEDIDVWAGTNGSTLLPSGAPVLTVYNAAFSGQYLSYFTATAARLAAAFLDTTCRVIVMASVHNAGVVGAAYLTTLNDFVTAVSARCGLADFIAANQNPQYAPRNLLTGIVPQAQRNSELLAWAVNHGRRCIDVAGDFMAQAVPYTSYMNADGVHPNTAGQSIILATHQREF